MQKPQKKGVFELCGVMGRSVALLLEKCKNLKNLKKSFLSFFELCGIMWRDVALFWKKQKPQKL